MATAARIFRQEERGCGAAGATKVSLRSTAFAPTQRASLPYRNPRTPTETPVQCTTHARGA